MTTSGLEFIRKFPDKCCAEVTRKGESQPCDRTAVAAARNTEDDTEDAYVQWWPVCAYHTRGHHMVPLAELLKAMTP